MDSSCSSSQCLNPRYITLRRFNLEDSNTISGGILYKQAHSVRSSACRGSCDINTADAENRFVNVGLESEMSDRVKD